MRIALLVGIVTLFSGGASILGISATRRGTLWLAL